MQERSLKRGGGALPLTDTSLLWLLRCFSVSAISLGDVGIIITMTIIIIIIIIIIISLSIIIITNKKINSIFRQASETQ